MTEACSGLSGRLQQVEWYEVPNVATFSLSNDLVNGYYAPINNRVVLAGEAVFNGGTVRHEMLHALSKHGGHLRRDFLQNCAGVVDCHSKCVSDAGPPPPINPSIARVPSSDLVVDVRFLPEAPTKLVDDGVFSVMVTAKNPRSDSVLIDMPPATLQSFFYLLQRRIPSDTSQHYPGGLRADATIVDEGVVRFAPGETKQHIFDLRIGTNGIPPSGGSYTVTGGYGHQHVKKTLAIGP